MVFLDKFKQMPFSSFYISGAIFVIFLIMSICLGGTIKKELYGFGRFGFSWWLALLAILAICAESVIKYVKKENYFA